MAHIANESLQVPQIPPREAGQETEEEAMNPACHLCKGACCEGIRFPVAWFKQQDIINWFSYHGTMDDPDHVYLDCPCCHLNKAGECSIYFTRPNICMIFEVGSEACEAAVRRNRPKEAEAIIALFTSKS